MPTKKQHILIIRLSAMGDVAMTIPVLIHLLEQNPNVEITVVSRPFFHPFFSDLPRTHFFPVDLQNRHKGFWGLIRLYKDLKKLNIDFVADLHNVLRSKIARTLFSFSGTKTAYTDKGRKEKKVLTRLEIKEIQPLKSMFERHVETFKKLGFTIDLSQPIFKNKYQLTDKIIKQLNLQKDTDKIGIAPFAQYETKVYPLDLMQKVINTLAQKENTEILLFGGGRKEIEQLYKLQNQYENVKIVAEKLSFEEEIQLISNLNTMLSMDSGNAHIAAIFGIKVITLWGATHPYAGFIPFAQPLENCITSDRTQYPFIPTSVYGNKLVKGYDYAMRTISVELIVSKI